MGYVCRISTHSPVHIRQKAKKESGLYGLTDENALLEEDGPRRCFVVRVERGDQEPLGRRFGGIPLVRYDRRGVGIAGNTILIEVNSYFSTNHSKLRTARA